MAMAGIDSGRRGFLLRIARVLGGVAILEAGWIAISSLWPRGQESVLGNRTGVHSAGSVERFARGSVTAVAEGKFYVVRLEDGGILALHLKCTHLGCSVPWNADEQRFACPCHASAFDIHGDVLSAPAPRPLDLFPVVIEDGVVMVDTTKLIRRSRFEASQAVRA
jgi:cytochrome b6-f complex iron-sulfur subunit